MNIDIKHYLSEYFSDSQNAPEYDENKISELIEAVIKDQIEIGNLTTPSQELRSEKAYQVRYSFTENLGHLPNTLEQQKINELVEFIIDGTISK